ncbi:uncharacterized protein LOC143027798 [Oratosquilla oratoria]|uniref:uncharacterized protein LOC143027798 n=1 Tax=Oratosquilla oratoria TaxID=337810 RepID=UPI003F7610BC
MSRKLRPEEQKEAQECFTIFSKSGKMETANLGMAVRSLGLNPTNNEVEQALHELGRPLTINFQEFLSVLKRDFPGADTEEEILEAFGVFDKDGDGTIATSELRHVLMTMGERLTREEVDLIIREADIDGDGQIRYDQFVQIMKKDP